MAEAGRTHPQKWTDAAARAIWNHRYRHDYTSDKIADDVLDAVVPLIEAAQRERIAANLEADAEIGNWHWKGKDALRAFADVLRGQDGNGDA